MEPETQGRIRTKFDFIMDCLGAAGGITYESAMAAVQPHIQDQNPFFLALISSAAQAVFPPGCVSAAYSSENLELCNTREKIYAMLSSLPEEGANEMEAALDYAIKKGLPAQRNQLQGLTDSLPHSPGGAPSKTGNQSQCRMICESISRLRRSGVKLGVAQKRVAEHSEVGMSVRSVQRIWQKRDKLLIN